MRGERRGGPALAPQQPSAEVDREGDELRTGAGDASGAHIGQEAQHATAPPSSAPVVLQQQVVDIEQAAA
ncbi:MAG: hypothetical protein R3F55_20930 [Alphaproteobacteria bacterium]